MALSIEEVMDRAGFPPGPDTPYTLLKGGLSHRIVRIDPQGEASRILRVLDPAVTEAGLGIPLAEEIENTARAATNGAGPKVERILSDPPALVLEFLPGRTLSAGDVRDPGTIPRIAAACLRLHATQIGFVNDFDIFAKARELLALCRRHGLPVPDGYADRFEALAGIEAALAVRPLPQAPCHNDLLPGNLVDDGHEIRIIDYQLSGMNDPAFELGDIAAEADYTPDLTEALTAAYFGDAMTGALLARVRLYLIVSNITWTLWFSVHQGLLADHAADAEFDYGAEAADKWAQAVRDLDSGELGRLIDNVRRLP